MLINDTVSWRSTDEDTGVTVFWVCVRSGRRHFRHVANTLTDAQLEATDGSEATAIDKLIRTSDLPNVSEALSTCQLCNQHSLTARNHSRHCVGGHVGTDIE